MRPFRAVHWRAGDAMKETTREPWSLEAFVRHFNAKAARSGVMPLGAVGAPAEAELRDRYERGLPRSWTSIRDFAEAEVLLYSRD